MDLNILEILQNQPEFSSLVEKIHSGKAPSLLGFPKAARLPVLAALKAALEQPILLVTDKTDRALILEDEWKFWVPDQQLILFPEPDPLFYEKIAWTRKTRRDRLKILASLSSSFIPGGAVSDSIPVILAPIRALITRTIPRRDFLTSSRVLRVNSKHSLGKLAAEWVRIGYESSPIVTVPGQFARRGGILDIWPPGDRFPARIEFFGDEIDMLRRFDPETQGTIQKIESVTVTPAREFTFPDFPQDGEKYTEYHIPLLHQERSTILNYLSKDTMILLDDQENIEDAVIGISQQAESLRQGYLKEGSISKDFPTPYLTWDELQPALVDFKPIALGPAGGEDRSGLPGMFSPNERFGGELKSFISHLAEKVMDGESPVIISRQAPRLSNLRQRQH